MSRSFDRFFHTLLSVDVFRPSNEVDFQNKHVLLVEVPIWYSTAIITYKIKNSRAS